MYGYGVGYGVKILWCAVINDLVYLKVGCGADGYGGVGFVVSTVLVVISSINSSYVNDGGVGCDYLC